MPGCRCAVYGCNNSRIVTKAKGENITYHHFPKAKDFTTVKEEWVIRCKRIEKINPDTSHICSVHFTEDDYQRDLRNELLGLPIRKILRKTAIPTLNLPSSIIVTRQRKRDGKIGRESRFSKKQQTKTVNKVMKDTTNTVSHEHDCIDNANEFLTDTCLQTKYDQLLANFKMIKRELLEEKERSKHKIRSLNLQLNYYKKKCLKITKNVSDAKGSNSKVKPTAKRKIV